MSPAESKNVAGGTQKCRWRSPKMSPAEPTNITGGAQKCRRRSPQISPAEPKNVAGGAHKYRRRIPKMPKRGRKKILCRRSPTNAGRAGGLFVLIAIILSEVKKYRDSGAHRYGFLTLSWGVEFSGSNSRGGQPREQGICMKQSFKQVF